MGQRRFARLARHPPERPGTTSVPDDGMCLSAFLVLRPPAHPGRVLVGRMDPTSAWDEVALIDSERVRAIGDRWVLPAAHLLLFEGPDDAARRIAAEMLHRDDLALEGPRVFSEAYRRAGGPQDPHWDLQFVYSGAWSGPTPPTATVGLWKELEFVDVRATSANAFGRGHADVLALMGLPPKEAPRS